MMMEIAIGTAQSPARNSRHCKEIMRLNAHHCFIILYIFLLFPSCRKYNPGARALMSI